MLNFFIKPFSIIIAKLIRIEAYLIRNQRMEKHIMTTLADVQAAIAILNSKVATEAAQATTVLNDLGDQIAALKAQLASGSVVSEADLTALVMSLTAAQAAVDNIIADPVVRPPVAPV